MIIAIAFFALSAAVCISLFVQAHLVSKETRVSNLAVIQAQSVAECFKAAGGSAQDTARLLSVDSTGNEFSLYYDKDWQQAGAQEYSYRVDVSIDEEASPRSVSIAVVDRQKEGEGFIYTLEAKKYVP